jgi:hypothetical protein
MQSMVYGEYNLYFTSQKRHAQYCTVLKVDHALGDSCDNSYHKGEVHIHVTQFITQWIWLFSYCIRCN